MKKILTVALSTAMAFSMFASVAFGDTAVTPQQKFDALAAKGIFNGYPDGSAHLEKEMTRAEFAKVITKLLGLKEVTGTLSYKDKGYDAKNWAVPYIEAVTAAGIMQGQDNVKKIFNYNGKVTIQEMATVLTRALKLEIPANPDNNAADWAKGYVQAAINKGLISKDANFKANASRSQLVEAAYAIDQAANITFTYKVVDPSNVEFTLSTGEVVKVKLDKPLEANKETEVKFKDAAGNEYTAKVTYVVTTATKVESASATNLKQVVVTFDGSVDETSAQTVSNYTISGLTIESATLGADKKSVTLLLSNGSTFVNQRQASVVVNNVKNADSSKTISGTVSFTPLDVAVPTVQSVQALGTKAVKIKFSEPVRQEGIISSNFRIDDKAIAATVKYTYPDTVILATELTEGAHTLRVSNVTDYSGLTIVPNTSEFTATVDTAAPVVQSVTSKDLKQVTITFDEPVKSVSGAYANVSSFKSETPIINDNKVTLNFANPLNATENTIYLTGVTDYSGNSANLDTKVTPTLDTVRPVIVDTKFEREDGNYVATLVFSKTLNSDSAKNRENYVLKNAAGNIATTSTAVNTNGNPIRQPVLQADGKTVKVNFGPTLNNETYTLTVSGVKDSATIGNVLLPYTVSLPVGQASETAISSAWKTQENGHNYVYVQFNRSLATEGAGSALNASKYLLNVTNGKQIAKTDNDVQLLTANTVRLEATNLDATEFANLSSLKANYIADSTGAYLASGSGYSATATVKSSNNAVVLTGDIEATGKKTVVVKFDGQISNYNASDFVIKQGATADTAGTTVATGSTATLSNDQQTLTITLDKNLDPKFADGSLTLVRVGTGTVDAFGNVVTVPTTDGANELANKIPASLVDEAPVVVTPGADNKTFNVSVKFDKNIAISQDKDLIKGLLEVVIGNQKADVNATSIVLDADNSTLKFTVTTEDAVPVGDTIFSVTYTGGSAAVKATPGNVNVAAFSEQGEFTATVPETTPAG